MAEIAMKADDNLKKKKTGWKQNLDKKKKQNQHKTSIITFDAQNIHIVGLFERDHMDHLQYMSMVVGINIM